MKPKVIFSANGTLTDFSVEMNDYFARTAAIPLAVTTDYLYIGSYFPFNHFYLKVNSANAVTSVLSAHYWDNTRTWRAVSLLTDETLSAGKTLAQNGYVSWNPDPQYSWSKEDTVDSAGTALVTGLGNIKLYGFYWLRLKVSATVTSTTKLEWLGHRFSVDNDLGSEYPDLVTSATMTAFKSGKTDWEEQHIRVAELIVKDLKRIKALNSGSQILDWEDFKLASVSKLAEIIYSAFGSAHKEQKDEALVEYKKRFNGITAKIDENANAQVDEAEKNIKSVVLFR